MASCGSLNLRVKMFIYFLTIRGMMWQLFIANKISLYEITVVNKHCKESKLIIVEITIIKQSLDIFKRWFLQQNEVVRGSNNNNETRRLI